jgi:prevent-host-death family protein
MGRALGNRHVYTEACTLVAMTDSVSVREARSGLAAIIDRAIDGGATVITRDGNPVAAVVSMDDYNALEDAIDEYFARKAEDVAAAEEGGPRYGMSDIVADIFDEQALPYRTPPPKRAHPSRSGANPPDLTQNPRPQNACHQTSVRAATTSSGVRRLGAG